MRLVVHDYSGHPFQVQLSRELARRGHNVLHLHCPSYRTGKGAVERTEDDSPRFEIEPVTLAKQFEKYSLWKRPQQEWAYGRKLVDRIGEFAPQLVLSSNTPLLSQRRLLKGSRRLGARFVFWQQDIYSVPMKRHLERKIPVLGGIVGSRSPRPGAVDVAGK